MTPPAGDFDRGVLSGTNYSNLLRDGTYGTAPAIFEGEVLPGTYQVTVTMGDGRVARDHMNVTTILGVAGDGCDECHGSHDRLGSIYCADVHRHHERQWPDSTAVQRWRWRSVLVAECGNPPHGDVGHRDESCRWFPDADGTTTDEFAVTGATAGGLYTLSSDAGTIVGASALSSAGPYTLADVDGRYAGTQFAAPGTGTFYVYVQRPASAGTLHLNVDEVTGASRGRGVQAYVAPTSRRFDFNASSVVTQTGYTGVLGTTTYTAAQGYGWLSAVSSFDASAVSGTNYSNLIRDTNFSTSTGIFQADLANGTYEVTVALGNAQSARNLMNVTVPVGILQSGAANVTNVSTVAGQLASATFVVQTDPSGHLQLQFSASVAHHTWDVADLEDPRGGHAVLGLHGTRQQPDGRWSDRRSVHRHGSDRGGGLHPVDRFGEPSWGSRTRRPPRDPTRFRRMRKGTMPATSSPRRAARSTSTCSVPPAAARCI